MIARRFKSTRKMLGGSVYDTDAQMASILDREKQRQRDSITLIPSENFTSKAVMSLLGSEMQNKYSEGYPNKRYYGGNEIIDESEALCQERALQAFKLDPEQWGVNVQPLSGCPANFEVYAALLRPQDRLMGLDLPHGGHLSHGYQANGRSISYVSKFFQTMPYRLDESTGIIDYDMLAKTAPLFRPKILIAGTSAYSRLIDYARMREIADSVGAYLMSDMAHIAGLVAAGVIPSPFDFSDIVTTTAHKSLRGPRGAMIFFRKGIRSYDKKGVPQNYDLENKINFSVFPGMQGGPHNHTIAALSVALKQAASPEFREYQKAVVANAKTFAAALQAKGFKLVSGGTDNHLILIDLKPLKIDGARVEAVLDRMNIAANKNTVPGDRSALVPGGLRLGTPAMTTREFMGSEFERVAEYIDKAVKIAQRVKISNPKQKLEAFKQEVAVDQEIADLKEEISEWAKQYPVPGDL